MDAGIAGRGAVSTKIDRWFEARRHAAGAQHYLESGDALPEATLAACRAADAILFGAMGLPHVRGADGTEIIPQLDIRFALDLYAGRSEERRVGKECVSPCRSRWEAYH